VSEAMAIYAAGITYTRLIEWAYTYALDIATIVWHYVW
jgi:hypothetical protein